MSETPFHTPSPDQLPHAGHAEQRAVFDAQAAVTAPPIVVNHGTAEFTAPAPAPQPEKVEPVYVGAARPRPLFRLDDLENERVNEPFYFEFRGQVFELFDPKDLRWQDVLVAQDNPHLLIHLLMPESQRDAFMELDLSLRKMEALFARWQKHFGLGTPEKATGSARS